MSDVFKTRREHPGLRTSSRLMRAMGTASGPKGRCPSDKILPILNAVRTTDARGVLTTDNQHTTRKDGRRLSPHSHSIQQAASSRQRSSCRGPGAETKGKEKSPALPLFADAAKQEWRHDQPGKVTVRPRLRTHARIRALKTLSSGGSVVLFAQMYPPMLDFARPTKTPQGLSSGDAHLDDFQGLRCIRVYEDVCEKEGIGAEAALHVDGLQGFSIIQQLSLLAHRNAYQG